MSKKTGRYKKSSCTKCRRSYAVRDREKERDSGLCYHCRSEIIRQQNPEMVLLCAQATADDRELRKAYGGEEQWFTRYERDVLSALAKRPVPMTPLDDIGGVVGYQDCLKKVGGPSHGTH